MITALILSGLATAILLIMFKDLDGPYDIFDSIRLALGVYRPESFFAKLFDCYWCLGTWVAVPVSIYVIAVFGLSILFWPLYWLSSIIIAGIIYKYVMF